MPRATSSGGPVVAAPRVVPVFFPGDELQGRLEEFLHALEGSAFWTAATQEYGVGALTVAPSVVAPSPPSTDDELRAWLAARPEAGPQSIFAVFYPASTPLEVHGKKSCQAFDGYHLAGGSPEKPAVYAVISRCKSGAAGFDAVTAAASHELVEAATDPFYESDPAFASADADHGVWTLATVGEVSDLCELEPQAQSRALGPFMVQRSWSNAAAAAGHDPCVPAPDGPYFNALPVLDQEVLIDAGGGNLSTKGIRIPVGEERTIDIALFSDGPAEDWRVQARDTSALFGGAKELDLTLDRDTGHNGDVLHLKIRPKIPGRFGGSVLVVTSAQGSTRHVALAFVAN